MSINRGIALRRRMTAPVLLLLATAVGCTPVGVVAGAGATVGSAAVSEKGLSGTIDDTKLRAQIDQAWLNSDGKAFLDVALDINEGVVTLTGKVKDPQVRIDAVRLTWQVPGVRQVYDEIQVEDKSSLIDEARDIRVADVLRARLLLDKDIKNINYSVDCVNGVVYIMGIAQDQDELDRVIAHARDIGGVTRVVNHAVLKTDPTRTSS